MESTWLKWSLRRRWRSLAALALLVALSTAVVVAAASGAERGRTALHRLLEQTSPATVNILPNVPGFDWDVVRKIPEVQALATYWVTAAYVVDGDLTASNQFYFPDDYTQVEKPVVFAGRLPDPNRADEVVVTPRYVEATGKGVGDTVTLGLYKPESVAQAWDNSTFTLKEPDGPQITATIVGVVRSYWTSLTENDYADIFTHGTVFASPGLYTQYLPNLVGRPDYANTSAYANAYVKLANGAADIPAFTQHFTEVTGRSDIDMWIFADHHASTQSSLDFEAWSLLALAAAAAIASLFLVGQALARTAGSDAAELAALEGAGLSNARRIRVVATPILVTVVCGIGIGLAAAFAASVLFPLGTAALYEPNPGLNVNALVFVAVGLGALLSSATIVVVSAWSVGRRSARAANRPSAIATWASGSGLPVSTVMGTRFALERGIGAQAIPVRPALVAIVAGVAGLVAAMTFSAGLSDATADPLRWGQSWQMMVGTGYSDTLLLNPVDDLVAEFSATSGVQLAAQSRQAIADSGEKKIAMWSYPPDVASHLVLTSGRVPANDREILLGPTTRVRLGVNVGDTIHLRGSSGTIDATIVGESMTPSSSHSDYDDSAWIPDSTFHSIFGDTFKLAGVIMWAQPGSDVDALAAKLTDETAAYSYDGSVMPVQTESTGLSAPGKVTALGRVGVLPQALGVFLIVLAVGAVGHALITAISRRRRDIAVLRAVGQTPGQARLVAWTQALVIGAFGLIAGIPLGLALGRTLWRLVAQQTPVAFADPSDPVLLSAVVPATAVVVLVLAVWPAHRAASMRVSTVLRTE